ncbi:hypothetical protein [Stenotrophomonas sp. YIM B06876]|uniref:hypothetical protein n=1 Tax=Stenotrophomonas sp. YIM B06876 TaxID=3060211 RepID=UPI002738EC0F|nr:hypothetical protein [Stenotrophomonas sp. YIM B06876]
MGPGNSSGPCFWGGSCAFSGLAEAAATPLHCKATQKGNSDMYRKAAFLVLFGFSATCMAQGKSAQLDAKAPFGEQRQSIEAALAAGKVYSEISPQDRSTVMAALARMGQKLGENGVAASLGESDKVQVFNDQELVNTLLTQAQADSRLICRRERVVGSNLPQNVCQTVAERREARENGVEILRNQRTSQEPVGAR